MDEQIEIFLNFVFFSAESKFNNPEKVQTIIVEYIGAAPSSFAMLFCFVRYAMQAQSATYINIYINQLTEHNIATHYI